MMITIKNINLRRAAGILSLVCSCLVPSSAAIDDTSARSTSSNLTFALVPKNTKNPFFDVVREGCYDSASSAAANVTCLFVGPDEDDAVAQADIIDSLIDGSFGKIDGISVSVLDPVIISPAINRAVASGIPVITFDSDAGDSDRIAYIGTDNEAFGTELGKLLVQLAPEGGKYGVLAASAPNIVQRFDGVTRRLADDTKWTPVSSAN
jgi:ABC-type sugar transport system substrate-binding protein